MAYRPLPSGVLVDDSAQFAEKPVYQEIATTQDGRDITRGYVSGMALLAPQDGVLNTRGGGDYELYRQVRSDPQVETGLKQLRLGIIATESEVIPGGSKRQDKAAAQFLQESLDRIAWDNICDQMHFGFFYGFAVAECIWAQDGRFILLDAIKVRDRLRFGFDNELRLRLKTYQSWEGELLPDCKFWYFDAGADHGDEPYGLGLAHWLYWPVLFKRTNIKFWLIGAEKFGSPSLWGLFPPNTSPEEQTKLLNTLLAMQTDSALITPDTMRVEKIEAMRSGRMEYAELCEYMDHAIMKLITGQVMTSEAVGGQYKAEVQNEVKADIAKSQSDIICQSFNMSVAKWLTDWNFPGAAYPQVWRRPKAKEDLKERSEIEKNLFDIGYRPTLADVQNRYGGEWEEVRQAEVSGDQGSLEGQVGFAETTNFALPADQRELEDLIDDVEQGDLEDQGQQMLQPIIDIIEKNGPEEAMGKLAEVYDDMDTSKMEEMIARMIFLSKTWGRLNG